MKIALFFLAWGWLGLLALYFIGRFCAIGQGGEETEPVRTGGADHGLASGMFRGMDWCRGGAPGRRQDGAGRPGSPGGERRRGERRNRTG